MLRYDVEINSNVDKLTNEITIEAFERSMVEIQNLAKMNAPVKTGNLQNSILLEIISDTKILITSFASYSAFLEYGTFKMNAQPFMRPAIDEVRFNKLNKIVEQVTNSK